MNDDELLELFKIQLGVRNTLRDKLYSKILQANKLELERKGITLTDSVDDTMFLVDYAEYNYKKRSESVAMSENLKLRLKNRIMRARGGSRE